MSNARSFWWTISWILSLHRCSIWTGPTPKTHILLVGWYLGIPNSSALFIWSLPKLSHQSPSKRGSTPCQKQKVLRVLDPPVKRTWGKYSTHHRQFRFTAHPSIARDCLPSWAAYPQHTAHKRSWTFVSRYSLCGCWFFRRAAPWGRDHSCRSSILN